MSALPFKTVERKFSGPEQFFSGLPGQHAAQAGSQNAGNLGNSVVGSQRIRLGWIGHALESGLAGKMSGS
jgi:hypothetical protein